MYRIFLALCITAVISVPVYAQTSIEEVTALVRDAYGGKRLDALKSISIESDRRLAYPGTNYGPEFNEFIEDRYHFQIDLNGQRAATERYVRQSGNIYHDHNITTQNGLAQISYPLNRVIYESDFSFYESFGTVFRISDTLLAYVLTQHSDRAILAEPTEYRGRQYHQTQLTLPGSDAPLLLGVDAESGLIMQMTRQPGSREIIYLFRDHAETRGISYARENQVYLNGSLFDFEQDRRVKVNGVRNSAFKIPGSLDVYVPPEESEIKVHAISETVHHVGRGINNTTFVQSEGFVIASGGNDGFADRYAAYRKQNPSAGPLRFLVITHEHEFGRSGHEDALELGANLIVSKTIEKLAKDNIDAATHHRIKTVESGEGLGTLAFYEISTAHSPSMLVTYVSDEKLILEEDHYRSVFQGVPGHLYDASVSLVEEVDKLGLDVVAVLSGHGAKLESWSVLQSVVEDQEKPDCFRGRKICRSDW